jgi:hypothetical protein
MITRIAKRVFSYFLKISGIPLIDTGTVQIGNRVAKYSIKNINGSLNECSFRLELNLLGNTFILSGNLFNGKVHFKSILGDDGRGKFISVDTSKSSKVFGVDPELWVKRVLKDAMIRSSGPSADVNNIIVVDGEIIDVNEFPEETDKRSVPMSKAV